VTGTSAQGGAREAGPFWIDDEYDRATASDGRSRYGTHLGSAAFEPWTDHDRHVELAVFAWDRATDPMMAPGYVRWDPTIKLARLERSRWGGELLAIVDLVMPQPPALRHLRAGDERGHWRDWPTAPAFSGEDVWYEPGGDEVARSPFLLCSARLRFAVPSAGLPRPRPDVAAERW
jgi:hypothetical protein